MLSRRPMYAPSVANCPARLGVVASPSERKKATVPRLAVRIGWSECSIGLTACRDLPTGRSRSGRGICGLTIPRMKTTILWYVHPIRIAMRRFAELTRYMMWCFLPIGIGLTRSKVEARPYFYINGASRGILLKGAWRFVGTIFIGCCRASVTIRASSSFRPVSRVRQRSLIRRGYAWRQT